MQLTDSVALVYRIVVSNIVVSLLVTFGSLGRSELVGQPSSPLLICLDVAASLKQGRMRFQVAYTEDSVHLKLLN